MSHDVRTLMLNFTTIEPWCHKKHVGSSGYEVFLWLMSDSLSLHFARQAIMRKTCFTLKTWLPKAGWRLTLFSSYDQTLSGSAVVMGSSILLRLVIRSIDWTPPQLSVNPRREAEDTVSLRRKKGWKQEGWSTGKMMFSYAWLGLRKEHVFPNIAMRPEDMVFSSLWSKVPWMKGSWKAINISVSTWFMLSVYRRKRKQLPE